MLTALQELLQPVTKVAPDVWATSNRTYPASAGVPGPRDLTLTPYIIPFVRFFEADGYEICTLITGTQSSKTDGILDVMGWRLATRPRPQLYVGPTKDFVRDQFEPRLMKLFDEAPSLAAKVARGKRNKKTLKTVNGVSVRLAWGGSPASLASDQAGDVYIDEFDKMSDGMKGDADVLSLAKARADTYADRKIAVTSTPLRGTVETEVDPATGLEFWKVGDPQDIESHIWKLWQTGTRHHWAWRCPHCDAWFIPRTSLLHCDEGASATAARRKTWIEAPCGCVIEERHKSDMNAGGMFIAPGMTINEAGDPVGEPADNFNFSLWVSGLASPFLTWGERLQEIMVAKEVGSSEARQGAQNKTGELWSPIGGDVPDWTAILNRREPYKAGFVPFGVLRITMGVDVQGDRLVFVIRGWGARGTSWLIKHGYLYGDTSQTRVWAELMELRSTLFDGMPIHMTFIDSGFRPGKKITLPLNRVYQFARRFKRSVHATKGSSHSLQRPLTKVRPDVKRDAEVDKYGLELIRLDTDYWKSYVHERLTWPLEQIGAWHINEDADEDYCRQLVAEQRIITDSGKPQWVERSRQNHFLDAEAMAAAAGFLLNVHHLRSAGRRQPAPESIGPTAEEAAEMPPVATVPVAKRPKGLNRFQRLAQKMNGNPE